MTPALALAAHNIRDHSTPITVHVAAILDAANTCHTTNDELGNCATCPLPAAALALAEYVNNGFAATKIGANR